MKSMRGLLLVAFLVAVLVPGVALAEKASKAELVALVHASGSVEMGKAMLKILPEQIFKAAQQEHPDIPDKLITIATQEFQREDKVFTRELSEMAAQCWGKYLTRKEVLELTQMYKRPVFKKALALMPRVMQESSVQSQAVAQRLVQRVMPRIEARAKKELGLNLSKK